MPTRLTTFALYAFLAVHMLLCLSSLPVCAKESEGLPTVSVQQLPPEARQTLVLIYQNGPFPYSRDGTVFGNREKRLPTKPRGHYREYTVPTPGAQNRGARRIVCGGEKPSAPDLCYYTADHYQSFQRIRNETTQP